MLREGGLASVTVGEEIMSLGISHLGYCHGNIHILISVYVKGFLRTM
jgi:hypothetical protein